MDSRFHVRLALAAATLTALFFAAATAGAAPTATIGAGAWSWFADPRAVYYAGVHKRTYVGWAGVHGDMRVLSNDYDTKLITTAVLTEPGDHFAKLTVTDGQGAKSVFVSDVVVAEGKPAGGPSWLLVAGPTAVTLAALLAFGFRKRKPGQSAPA